jgi:flavin-dependent dehydrogenase
MQQRKITCMRIAIVGAGVSGSYLACMISKMGHEIEVYETNVEGAHWPICAWGGSKNMLEKFSQQAGLEFNEYINHTGRTLRIDLPGNKVEYLELKGLVTYDKRKWESDLLRGVRVSYGRKCNLESQLLSEYDLVIDCTGFHRSLLPKSEEDFIIPAYEYLVENLKDIEDFYVIGYKGARGYFWCFPLSKGEAFVGAGDLDRRYYGISEFLARHPECNIKKKIGRPIRLAPPRRMQPFYWNNVVGVGESIGCVFPMLGEGIIPSLICCDIFLRELTGSNNLGKGFDFKHYSSSVLKRFGYYDDVYRIIRLKMASSLNVIRHFKLMMNMYQNMKREEDRFGFEVSLAKMNRFVNAL